MANTIIVSPSLTTEGDASGNLFVFASGALSGSTIVGGAGKDTVEMNSGNSAVASVDINTKGGQDSIAISATEFSGSTIKLGAGADTLSFSGASGALDTFYGGDGNDVLDINAAIDISTILLGAGADVLTGAAAVSASGASIKLGAGNDTVVMTAGELASATILGGGGADSISLDIDAASTAVKIASDAAGVVGADTITFYNTALTLDEPNLQGAGGADVINFNGAGDLAGTGKILGNAGGDAITLSATTFSAADGLTIGGGQGNDTITLDEFGSAGSGAFVIGGGGADSIILDANDGGSAGAVSAGGGYGSIIGGAGADSIVFSGDLAASAGAGGVLVFSSVSDSTESKMDIVSFTAGAGEGAFLLNLAMSDNVAGNATDADLGLRISAGVVQSAGGTNFGDMISASDTLITTTGRAGVFAHSGDAYVFVQGGSTDLVVRFDSQDSMSAGDLAITQIASGDFRLNLTSD